MGSQPAAIAVLPHEVLQRVLIACDWTSVARFACVSRHFRLLVRGLQDVPLWRNELTHGKPESDAALVTQVRSLLQKLRFAARPDVCIVFGCRRWCVTDISSGEEKDHVHSVLRKELPSCCSIVTCYSTMPIGRSGTQPPLGTFRTCGTLCMSLIHLQPGANLRISHCQDDDDSEPGEGLEDLPLESQILLLMAPDLALEEQWQAAMARRMPKAITAGGLSHGGTVAVSVAEAHTAPGRAGRAFPGGYQLVDLAALAFHGPGVDVSLVSVRGFVPRGDCYRVDAVAPIVAEDSELTQVTRVTVGRLAPGRTSNRFLAAAGQGTSEDGMREFAAAVRDTRKAGDSLVAYQPQADAASKEFNIADGPGRVDVEKQEVFVVHDVQPGTILCRARLEVEQAAQDFAGALETAKRRLGATGEGDPRPALGCFMFTCSRRAQYLSRSPAEETSALDAAFPGIPVSGFRAFREYGPAPLAERFPGNESSGPMDSATVLAFVQLKSPA